MHTATRGDQMTEPTNPPDPKPPAGDPPPDPKPDPNAETPEQAVKRLEGLVTAERKARQKAERELAETKRSAMTDDDKRLADARAEGRTEALKEVAAERAADVFRGLAAGKLGDVDAALEVLGPGLAQYVGDDGTTIDRDALGKVVERLGKAAPAAPVQPARVPAGPRGDGDGGGGESDFLRAAIRGR
jgi:hypothetical protein